MGGAIAEPTVDNDFFYLCPECNYDLGEDFSNMTDDSCPECDHPIEKLSLTRGSAPVIQLRGFNIDSDDDEDDPLHPIHVEGEEIRIEQLTSGYIPYSSFNLPYGYQWNDVESWRVIGDVIYITFESGIEWSYDLYAGDDELEPTGDFRAFSSDGDHLGDY